MIIKPIAPDMSFLAAITPENQSDATREGLLDWLKSNHPRLRATFDEHGAILLRGFEVLSHEDCSTVLESAGIEKRRYIAGNNPRTSVAENIYLSTTYPPSWRITLHSEMSHLNNWPELICLYCRVAPAAGNGGQTPLAVTRTLLEKMPKPIVESLKEKGVTYVQRMGGDGEQYSFGRKWREVFETDDKAAVTRFCSDNGIRATWEGERLIAEFDRPATAIHSNLGEEIWFNQAEQWHFSNIDKSVREVLERKIGRGNFPHHCRFGDGEEFSIEMLEEIRRVYDECSRRFQWENGDILILDNLRLAHGRDSFKGPREVYFAMGNWNS